MQITDRHYTDTDKQAGSMHAAGTLQVADITAAPALQYLTGNVYLFLPPHLARYHFQALH